MKSGAEVANATASQPRILVCDDALTVRTMMAATLGRRYQLRLAATAEEALACAPEFAPDLVITDLLLPGISGQELILRLRAIPAFEEVPMILLTGVGDPDARASGLEAGADDFLTKPVRERELLARVGSLLRLRRAILSLSQRTRTLEELNLALRATRERLVRSERLAALGSLAAALAHDINNPLSLVASAAGSLIGVIDEAGRLDPAGGSGRREALLAEARSLAEELAEGSRRLLGIGRDLRLFGSAGGEADARVRAEDAVSSAVALARDRSAAPARMEVVAVDSPVVEGPPHLVTLALLAILDRAVVAAGPSGRIELRIRATPAAAEIAVLDDGPQIPVELLPRVFEPFVRLHPAHESRGLGLSVAAGIVQGLGGHIDVDGDLTSGACFRVYLPLAVEPG